VPGRPSVGHKSDVYYHTYENNDDDYDDDDDGLGKVVVKHKRGFV